MRLLIILLSLSCTHPAAYANNTLFLPGDAFFFTRLTIAEIEALQDIESPILRYKNHRDGGCGTFGFQFLKIINMSTGEKENLAIAYKSLHDVLDTNLDGAKTLNVLVYNRDYAWEIYGIGLQYNENWADETATFGAVRRHLRLESFILDRETERPLFVERNWRDSQLVPALSTTSAPLAEQKFISKAPVVMTAKRRLIVLSESRLPFICPTK